MQLQGPAPFWVCSKYRSIVVNVLPPVVCIHSVQKTLKGEALFVYNKGVDQFSRITLKVHHFRGKIL